MDTTSHNFTWQTCTFGEHSNSVLYDVAIIDENNIWAVGEIYMNDYGSNLAMQCIGMDQNGIVWQHQVELSMAVWACQNNFLHFQRTDIWFEGTI